MHEERKGNLGLNIQIDIKFFVTFEKETKSISIR